MLLFYLRLSLHSPLSLPASMSLADLFPPGTDLCQLPSGYPPEGQTPNFVNPPSQRDLTIGLSVSLTAPATVFTLGRLYGNARKKLTWLDGKSSLWKRWIFLTIFPRPCCPRDCLQYRGRGYHDSL